MSVWELPDFDRLDPPPSERRQVRLHPIGWGDINLMARLTYRQFDAVAARAQREILRGAPPSWLAVAVRTVGAEGPFPNRWGEFWPPNGPIVLYQLAYEMMPDPENYYRQIKAVLVHEYEHSTGDTHGEAPLRALVRGR